MQPGTGPGGIVMRIVLVLAGLVFVLSLLVVTLLLLSVWSVRALWARLRGRPVAPPMFAYWRSQGWQQFYRGERGRQAAGADEVVDVQARPVDSGDQSPPRLDR